MRTAWKTRALLIASLAMMLCATACGNNGNNTPTPADMSAADMAADMPSTGDMGADQGQDMGATDPIPSVRFDPASQGFFDVGFPSDLRVKPDGKLDIKRWEEANNYTVLIRWMDAAEDLLDGWGLISGVFTYTTTPLDPATLPASVEATVDTSAGLPSVFLMDVGADSPDRGALLPLNCEFRPEVGTLHPGNQLGCRHPWGVVRRERTRYAFVVTTDVKDTSGAPLQKTPALEKLLAGTAVDGVHGQVDPAAYTATRDLLVERGLDAAKIAHMTLFTTGAPSARLLKVNAFYEALPEPQLDRTKPITMTKLYDDYAVLEAYYDVPIVQEGELPYARPPEGKLKLNAAGEVEQVGTQSIKVFITIPRQAQPAGGFPLLFWMHGSGGRGDDLITRGPQPDVDTPAPAGSGPAGVVAPYGIAGFGADFQLHGERFNPPDTTGLKLYNLIDNPRATVDNFLVAANEVTLHARLMRGLAIDPAEVVLNVTNVRVSDEVARAALDPGEDAEGKLRFNADRFTSLGQSMGSTIGLPAATIDRHMDAAIFSGSGGILVEIASTSKKPLDVNAVLRLLLKYKSGEPLDQLDPALHMIQHLWDYVDPTVHARYVFREPHPGVPAKHVLQHSGVSDGYFTAESKGAFAIATGVYPVAPVEEQPMIDHMRWGGRDAVAQTPVQGNTPEGVTGVVVQYQPSVLDGHNVAYQVPEAMSQYACFARSVGVEGAPILRSAADSTVEKCP